MSEGTRATSENPTIVGRELGMAVLAASDLFASRHWKHAIGPGEYHESLMVPDAESLMRTITRLINSAATSDSGYCASGRFAVDVCNAPCDDGCDDDGGRCAQVWVHLGEVHVRTSATCTEVQS